MKPRVPVQPRLAIAYLRVSTDEQRLGPEAQRAQIEAWAERGGVEIGGWHLDQGISGGASIEQRPGLLAALDDMAVRHAGMLVVARRDRLARDVIIAALVERLCERRGAQLVSAAGEGGEDRDATGQLMRRIIDAFAEYERALIRARTKAALQAKRARGERAGTVPWGFRDAGDGKLEPEPGEQDVAKLVLQLRAEGHSIRGVVGELAARGVVSRVGRPLHKTSVERLLGKPAAAASGQENKR